MKNTFFHLQNPATGGGIRLRDSGHKHITTSGFCSFVTTGTIPTLKHDQQLIKWSQNGPKQTGFRRIARKLRWTTILQNSKPYCVFYMSNKSQEFIQSICGFSFYKRSMVCKNESIKICTNLWTRTLQKRKQSQWFYIPIYSKWLLEAQESIRSTEKCKNQEALILRT